jgi:hypothetical protein
MAILLIGRSFPRPPRLADLEITKDIQPVVYRNNHNISFAGKVFTFGNGVSA